jgi:hypothetical protein
MFRKLILTIGATAAIAAAAISVPTAASAGPGWHHGWHGGYGYGYHGWHGGYGVRLYAPAYVGGSDCYVVRRVVFTPYGKRWRPVTVCN